MFLRKLLVIVVPLVLCGLCVFFLPLLGGFGLWSDLLQGLILGALLALLLPLSGASRRKEPFATLLVVPRRLHPHRRRTGSYQITKMFVNNRQALLRNLLND